MIRVTISPMNSDFMVARQTPRDFAFRLSIQGYRNTMYFKIILRTILITTLLSPLMVGQLVAAQSAEASDSEGDESVAGIIDIKLPRILVLGRNVDTSRSDIAGAAAIITEQHLEELQPLSAQDALRQVSGIHLREEEGFGFIPNIGLRGLTPDRSAKLLILEDGAPVAPSLFINNAAYYSPRIERMQMIEVLKGASALRYGPHTIGGTVNYITKDPSDGHTVTLSAGSHGFVLGMLESGVDRGDVNAGVNLVHARGDGARDNGFEMTDLMVKGGMELSARQSISAKVTYYDNEINTSYVGLRPDEFRLTPGKNPAPNDYFLTNRYSFDVNHQVDFNDTATLNTLFYWSRLERDYWRQDVIGRDRSGTTFRPCDGTRTCTGGRLRTFNMTGLDSRLELNTQFGSISNKTHLGVRLHTEDMDNRRVNGFTADARSGVLAGHDEQFADNLALYVENRFDFGNGFTLTPGLRMEHYRQKRIDRRPTSPDGEIRGTTSNTELMPGLGMTWQAHQSAQLYAGIYRGFAPARVASAISSAGVDQELDAERSTSVEIGVRGRVDRLRYEATLFQMDFSNQITPQAESAGITQTNAGETLHRGAEVSLIVPIGRFLSIDGNFTWIPTAEYQSTPLLGNDIKGNRLVYAPEYISALSLNYRNGPWHIGLNGNYISSQFADADNTVEESDDGQIGQIPSYTVFDLTANYRLSDRYRVFGAVRNLTDRTYIAGRQPDGIFPGIERTFRIGLEASF
jgi:Fe(3+) dicitrate transport protein